MFTPTYSKTFYEEYSSKVLGDYYDVYTARDKYHFSLVKLKVTNYKKEQLDPYFFDVILTTKEGLKYYEQSGFNLTREFHYSPPKLLLKDINHYYNILPKDSIEGYFYFEIPTTAVPDRLHFNYTIPPDINREREIIIDL